MKKKMMIAIILGLGWIFGAQHSYGHAAPAENVAEIPGEDTSDTQAMRAAYDEISAVKMKRYDELTQEIKALQGRMQELLAKEKELSREKEKAEAALAERSLAAEIAGKNVEKALEDASAAEEKIKSMAAAAAEESAARREKLEKLKAGLKESDEKIKGLENSKDKVEAEGAARDKEYKDLSRRLLELKGKDPAGEKGETARLKKLMGGLEMKAQEAERLRQSLAGEILTCAEKIRAIEEEISALESEDALQAKELRMQIEGFDKPRAGDKEKKKAVAALKKIAAKADATALEEKAAFKKIEENFGKASQEKLRSEKELFEKTEELKVRISALIAQKERERELLPGPADPGEKNLKARLKRAEKDVVALRRKTDRALLVNKELKLKFDKEMLEKHFNLASVYEMNGLYKDSEREYLECLEIDPDDADVHYNLAILYDDRLNDNNRARRHYYKFLRLRPIGESGERVKDWIMEAELENRLGKKAR